MTRHDKVDRKAGGDVPSAECMQAAEGQATWHAAVQAKYRKLVERVLRRPKTYAGSVVMTAEHLDADVPVVPSDAWARAEDVAGLPAVDAIHGFIHNRDPPTEKIYCILYVRVSTRHQMTSGSSIPAQLKLLLNKCQRLRLTVAAIAIEARNASGAERKALNRVDELLNKRLAHCVMVVEPSRLDRIQNVGQVRADKYAQSSGWIYYGTGYADQNTSYVMWAAMDTRNSYSEKLQEAEQEDRLRNQRAASGTHDLAAQGFVAARTRRDVFFLFDLDRSGTKPRLVPRETAASDLVWLTNQLEQATDPGTKGAAKRFEEACSERVGKQIKIDDLVGEFHRRLAEGFNPPSARAADIEIPCPQLKIAGASRDLTDQVLEGLDMLRSCLRAPRKNKDAADELIAEADRAKLAELPGSKSEVRFRVTHRCGPKRELIELKPKTLVGEYGPGRTLLVFCCPRCDLTKRYPLKRDYDKIAAMPSVPCPNCGRWTGMTKQDIVLHNGVKLHLAPCYHCLTHGIAEVQLTAVAAPDAEPAEGRPSSKPGRTGSPTTLRPADARGAPFFEDISPTAMLTRFRQFEEQARTGPVPGKDLMTALLGRPLEVGDSSADRNAWTNGIAAIRRTLRHHGMDLHAKRVRGTGTWTYRVVDGDHAVVEESDRDDK